MTIEYKGYTAKVELDEDLGVLTGHVVDTRDQFYFEGDTVRELLDSFHGVIDHYLKTCRIRGKSPDKPFTGKFLTRVPPELHRRLAVEAAKRDTSMNQIINDLLSQEFSSS